MHIIWNLNYQDWRHRYSWVVGPQIHFLTSQQCYGSNWQKNDVLSKKYTSFSSCLSVVAFPYRITELSRLLISQSPYHTLLLSAHQTPLSPSREPRRNHSWMGWKWQTLKISTSLYQILSERFDTKCQASKLSLWSNRSKRRERIGTKKFTLVPFESYAWWSQPKWEMSKQWLAPKKVFWWNS